MKPEWQKYFAASGTYALEPRWRRAASASSRELDCACAVVRQVAERLIVNEVKKTFEAEAETLRDLATLV